MPLFRSLPARLAPSNQIQVLAAKVKTQRSAMDKVANYLRKATEFDTRAEHATDPKAERAYAALAEAYRNLATHIERQVISLRQEANARIRIAMG
jgi:hypothetical protein